MMLSSFYSIAPTGTRAVLCAIFFASLAACASGPVGQDPLINSVTYESLPPPERIDLTAAERPYYLGPFDKLAIEVFGLSDMRRIVQVDASGRISYPLAGTIEVAGKTPTELSGLLEARLREAYVRNPEVTVNLEDALSQTVTVGGSVSAPGAFPVIGTMTLSRAIARAGGLTELAKKSDVVVFRTVGGNRYAGLYNLQAIHRGNYQDPEIFANDVIIVGESASRRLFRDALGATGLLSPVILLTGRGG